MLDDSPRMLQFEVIRAVMLDGSPCVLHEQRVSRLCRSPAAGPKQLRLGFQLQQGLSTRIAAGRDSPAAAAAALPRRAPPPPARADCAASSDRVGQPGCPTRHNTLSQPQSLCIIPTSMLAQL